MQALTATKYSTNDSGLFLVERYLPREPFIAFRDEFAAVPEAAIKTATRKIRGSPPLTPDSMTGWDAPRALFP